MGVAKTLWDLLDYRRVSENIVDTRDPGTGDHFAGPRPLRWRVGVSAALILGAGILAIWSQRYGLLVSLEEQEG
ncbi:MAG: hypothetical protein ACO3I5_01330, partial [Pontimonas sp.]